MDGRVLRPYPAETNYTWNGWRTTSPRMWSRGLCGAEDELSAPAGCRWSRSAHRLEAGGPGQSVLPLLRHQAHRIGSILAVGGAGGRRWPAPRAGLSVSLGMPGPTPFGARMAMAHSSSGIAGADRSRRCGHRPRGRRRRGFQDAVASRPAHGPRRTPRSWSGRLIGFQVHTAVAVLGWPTPKSRPCSPCRRPGTAATRRSAIEHRHAQAGAGIGQAQFHAALIVLGQGIDHWSNTGVSCTTSMRTFGCRSRSQVMWSWARVTGIEGLVDGHLHAQRGQSGPGAERW